MKYIIYFILIAIAIWIVRKFLAQFKLPKIGALAVVNGGVKCGKSTFAVALAIKEYKSNLRQVKFRNFCIKVLNKINKKKQREFEELPLLYSNIPLAIPYVPLTEELLLRQKRFRYKSIIYINEASLLADSKSIQDENVNTQLLLHFKLIGHETKGGCVILDTHTIADLHYSIKRTTSEYFYIHHLTKWIPFLLLAHVKECRYSEDNSTIAVDTEDTENTLRKVIILKNTWKKFDSYCFSYLTDNLEVEEKEQKAEDLKAKEIVSFNKKFKELTTLVRGQNEKEKHN